MKKRIQPVGRCSMRMLALFLMICITVMPHEIAVSAEDTGDGIIVDNISPELKVTYQPANGGVQNIYNDCHYFSDDVEITFDIREENFYDEDVCVRVSKNGAEPEEIHITSWEKTDRPDEYEGHFTLSGDGEYVLYASFADRSGNQMEEYASDKIVIDTVVPTISVTYANKDVIHTSTDMVGQKHEYFDSEQTATIVVEEHNFDPSGVIFHISEQDVTGDRPDDQPLSIKSPWSTTGDRHVLTITYPGDANYTFDVEYTDLAGNTAEDYETDYFTVDTAAPENLSVSYSTGVLETTLQGISFGFYKARMTVTVQADDPVSAVNAFEYGFMYEGDEDPEQIDQSSHMISGSEIQYSNDGRTAMASFVLPNEFNGRVKFAAIDKAGNRSEEYVGEKRIVIDDIVPVASVELNAPVQKLDGISYYNGDVIAEMTIKEANFFPEDVKVSVTKDGSDYPVSVSWDRAGVAFHKGSVYLKEDGDYFISVQYRDKSQNEMDIYSSGQITIDTQISQPVITVNGQEANGCAYPDYVIPAIKIEDAHFESYDVSLTRTSLEEKDLDVTEQFLRPVFVNETGGEGIFENIGWSQKNDGIYTMIVSIKDKAGNEASTMAVFSVNRFGSVYEYSDYLTALIANGGMYVKSVEDDLIITEYNADRIIGNSLDIEISHDGRPVDKIRYSVSPRINEQVSVGNRGWFQYQYTIDKRNFTEDGLYKIAVSSVDAAGNRPDTSNDRNRNIIFRVDSTPPEIESITGLEDEVISQNQIPVRYKVYDSIGLKSVKVYLDGEQIDTVDDFGEDFNHYEGTFVIKESNAPRKVRLLVQDLAGNETDTEKESFQSAFEFHDEVTVTTNDVVRFAADKTFPWRTVCGILFAAGGGIGICMIKSMKFKDAVNASK